MNSTIEKDNNKNEIICTSTITSEIKAHPEKKRKSVTWDAINLEEQEIEKKLHPVLKKINEPKTPYIQYEEGDDEYIEKLKIINQIKPTDEILNHVSNKLENKVQRKGSGNSSEEYIKIEVVEPDGSIKNEIVSQEHQESEEFKNKRHKAYENEFTNAKKYFNEHQDDDIIDQTLTNTLINKFSGKVISDKTKDNSETNK